MRCRRSKETKAHLGLKEKHKVRKKARRIPKYKDQDSYAEEWVDIGGGG